MADPDRASSSSAAPVPLQVLFIDDSEIDAELVLLAFDRGGYVPSWKRIDTAAALDAALSESHWDVITCEWVMPQFSALEALALVRERQIDVPVIIVSGQVGEDYAVTAMRSGAHDFVTKQNLVRLCPAVAREMREAEERRARRAAEEAVAQAKEDWERHVARDITERKRLEIGLREANTVLDCIVENTPLMVLVKEAAGLTYTRLNQAAEKYLGCRRADVLGKTDYELFPRTQADRFTASDGAILRGKRPEIAEGVVETRNRGERLLRTRKVPVLDADGSAAYLLIIAEDITSGPDGREALMDASPEA